jgi:chromosome segregation ATPase
MIRDRFRLLARRAVVFVAVCAVIGAGLVTVQVASQWRAQTAAFDPTPADAATVTDSAAAEADRADQLQAQLDAVAGQLSDLRSALATANTAMDGDAANAATTRDQLAQAQAKLQAVQGQLKAAQARLAALNRAAARQAALNRAAAAAAANAAAARPAGSGEGEHDD